MKKLQRISARRQRTSEGRYQFKLVVYTKINGIQSNRLVKNIINVAPAQITDSFYRVFIWHKIESAFNDLYLQRLMDKSDIERARKKFNEFLSNPIIQAVPQQSSERILVNNLLSRV
jgi:hypothetical protein